MIHLPPPPVPPALVFHVGQDGASLEAALSARASRDGWSDSQARWIGTLGAAAVKDDAAPVSKDKAYAAGSRALAVAYFDHALAEGKGRLVAFLTVIDLEKQVIVRGGGSAPDYPQTELQVAYNAVDAAARRGLSSKDQVAAGFEALRQQAVKGTR